MATVTLTANTFETAVTSDGITFVDWWASWCGPCKQFAPVYEAASEKHNDITFASVSTEEEESLAAQAQISSIPTLMAFRDGVLLYSEAGALPAAGLEEIIKAVRDVDMEDIKRQIADAEANN